MSIKHIVFTFVFLTSSFSLGKTEDQLTGKWIGFFNSMYSCTAKKVKFKHNKANSNQGVVVEYKKNKTIKTQLLYSVEYLLNSMNKKFMDPKLQDKSEIIKSIISTLSEVPQPEAAHCVSERAGTYKKTNLKIERTLNKQKWIYCFGIEGLLSKVYGPDFPGKGETKTNFLSEGQPQNELVFNETEEFRKRLEEIKIKKDFWKSAGKCFAKNGDLLTTYKKVY